ncbi:MAG: hypothetical protein A3F72_08885 [Bacteroidetes bacterium RIFCSPLOWO2_12_FULL_35_15]|nr:MAG: hypothetical protein A3F72_08885 [Bacteroidetes bacterium RIFCSPLOWO2_12_FULL_35_15]
MKTIEQYYEPYNFSATRCYVFTLDIGVKGFLRIEHKLPAYVRNLKEIFVSVSPKNKRVGVDYMKASVPKTPIVAGFITLNFNGQSLKCFQCAVLQTLYLNDCSNPLPFNELINRNSFIQGFFIQNTTFIESRFSYRISIYLHYLP